jgi:hypothetical protein
MFVSVVAQSFGVAAKPQSAPTLICLGAPAKPCGQVRQMLNPRTFGRPPANTPQSAREFDSNSAQKREKDVKDDLSQRLRSVCNHLSKAEFATLVCDMTREQLRGERIPGRKTGPC